MKKYNAVFMGLALLVSAGTGFGSEWVVRSDQGADSWDQGYPIGNGRIGLLSLGGFPEEKLYLNEHSIWARQEVEYPENAAEVMKEVRALAVAGNYAEADKLWTKELLQPEWRPSSYEFAGMAKLTHIRRRRTGIDSQRARPGHRPQSLPGGLFRR